MMQAVFLCTAVLLCVSHAQIAKHGKDNSICSDPIPPSTITSNKVKPNVTNQYHTRIECVIVNSNMTTDVHEYFDADNNRGMVRQMELGIEFYAWYDYDTNEFIGYYPTIVSLKVSCNILSHKGFQASIVPIPTNPQNFSTN
ncbi:hypothetical protein CHS0354_003415 [Potamilus streckersoni]|uniref:Uncharacterized protein n=1 Tax=Potamilus streckersoni TaxID=2493646 RepID=A0AAE0SPF6_9BIVA|nr:hypothetical protein CHS0354_003415 [Potamilus streckersoni]